MRLRPIHSSAFTLVEILIVVVILGILAAMVVPQLTNASQDAASTSTYSELQKLRRHVTMYKSRNSGRLPVVEEDIGTWGELIGINHLLSAPVNAWVGGLNSQRIVFGDAPDTEYQRDYGWIFNDSTGEVWAGGFDVDDKPLAR